MIDSFVLSHPQIQLDSTRVTLSEETFDFITNTCDDKTLLPIQLDLFSITPDARFHYFAVELHVETYLRTSCAAECPVSDRLLLEIVVLHRLKLLHTNMQDNLALAGRSIAVMGCMIQHKLTQLLLAIQSFQRRRVFNLGRIFGLQQTLWEIEFIGASAVVRTIRMLSRIPNSTVRFPTLEEDLDRGIDLFIQYFRGRKGLSIRTITIAASIKSINSPDRLLITRIHSKHSIPLVGAEDRHVRIAQGARFVSTRYTRRFRPIEISVGRPPDTDYELSVDVSDVQSFEEFLESQTQTPYVEEQGVLEPTL